MERKYFGCRVAQRTNHSTTRFFVFYARAKDIKEWAGIRRVENRPDGTQRVLRTPRAKAITRFLTANSINTIPNNILLAFEPGVAVFSSLHKEMNQCFSDTKIDNDCSNQLEWGTLCFSFAANAQEHEKPGLIVDGQHRLYGISDFRAENLPLLVIALVDASLLEQAFQFVVINNKAVRVPTDNVRAIIAHIDEEELQERLLTAGVRYGNKSPLLRDLNDLEISPFKDLLDWPYNKSGHKLVPLTAVEQATRFLQSAFDIEEDSDSLIEIFCAMWSAVKTSYSDLWGKENQLMKKVSINALNEYISERIKFSWEMSLVDIFDSDSVYNQVLSIIKLLPEEFWKETWSVKIQDNASMRNIIKSDLETLSNNSKMRKPWRENLRLSSQSEPDTD